MLKVRLVGDWRQASKLLKTAVEKDAMKKALYYATMLEAQEAKRQIVSGITRQSPAGKRFLPIAVITKILRLAKGFRGSKALLVSGTLQKSIVVRPAGIGRFYVGVLRNSRSADGRDLFRIATVHEYGAVIVIRVTAKMRRYLMMTLNKYGARVRTPHRFRGPNAGTLGRPIIVIRIPARPFIGPVLERLVKNRNALRKRMQANIASKLSEITERS